MPTATSTRLFSSSPSSRVGETITLQALVTGAAPTGNVQFKNRATVLSTVALVDGAASYPTAALAAGTAVLSASYVGDSNNDPSVSPALLQSIAPAHDAASGVPKRIATVHEHVQATAATTWTVVHNLRDYPVIDAYVDYEGELHKIIPSAVTYTDENTCTLTFTTPFSGFATVV